MSKAIKILSIIALLFVFSGLSLVLVWLAHIEAGLILFAAWTLTEIGVLMLIAIVSSWPESELSRERKEVEATR